MSVQAPLGLVDDDRGAAAVVNPIRLRILSCTLEEPDSAAGLARRLGLPRQRVNYHVRQLARAGLLRAVGQRRKGNMLERRYLATARSYVLAPELVGRLGGEVKAAEDRFSAAHLVALAGRMQLEVGQGIRQATDQGKRLATLSVSADLRFESAGQRARFAEALERAVTDLVGRFASPATAPDGGPGRGRPYRLVAGCYPVPPATTPMGRPERALEARGGKAKGRPREARTASGGALRRRSGHSE